MTKDNTLLCKFHIEGIPPMPRGIPQIDIALDIDANGVLRVNVIEKSTGKETNVRVSKEENERLARAANLFESQMTLLGLSNSCRCDNFCEITQRCGMQRLEKYMSKLNSYRDDPSIFNQLSNENKEKIIRAIERTTIWLNTHQSDPIFNAITEQESRDKLYGLDVVVAPILSPLGLTISIIDDIEPAPTLFTPSPIIERSPITIDLR